MRMRSGVVFLFFSWVGGSGSLYVESLESEVEDYESPEWLFIDVK